MDFGLIVAGLCFILIIIFIIIFIKLINGNWLLNGGPALSTSALVSVVELDGVDTDDYLTKNNKVFTAKPMHFRNIYVVDGPKTGSAVLKMRSKKFSPGMEIVIKNVNELEDLAIELDGDLIDVGGSIDKVCTVDQDNELSCV